MHQWRRSVINLGGPGPGHLNPTVVDSPGGLGRARSPPAKRFDAIYTVKQPYKIHIDVMMFNVPGTTEISVHAEFSRCRQN